MAGDPLGQRTTACRSVAIDLPLANVLAAGRADDGVVADGEPPDPIGALAAAAGEPDAERWWDDVIEHRGEGLPAFEAVAEAMTVVRAGTRPSRVGGAARGAHAGAIREAMRDGHDPIVVVCGAWHVPALDVAATHRAADRARLRGLPKAKVDVSWVPWTNARLAYAPPATAPVCAAPVGTTTSSATPGPRASPASSSTLPACCARPTCRRRPTT